MIATSLENQQDDSLVLDAYQEIPGKGLMAEVNHRTIKIGSSSFVEGKRRGERQRRGEGNERGEEQSAIRNPQSVNRRQAKACIYLLMAGYLAISW